MKAKIKVPLLVGLILLIVFCKSFSAKNLTLKQVFILSRHNVRYPLVKDLNRYSSKPWPPPAGHLEDLTPRGAQLEGYMGEYFSDWFKKAQFLPEGCPDEDTVYVYANTPNRTRATAKAFIDSAFKSCNLTVHHKITDEWDTLFKIALSNTTEAFKDMVVNDVNRKLQNNTELKAVYLELNKILEINGSDACKQDGICDLTKVNDTLLYTVNKPLTIVGAFPIARYAVDAFTVSYYNGVPIQDIAWGQITTPDKWKVLSEMGRLDQDVRYTTVAADIATPIIEYLYKTFKNHDEMPKLTMLVGHDTNLNAVAHVLGLQSIELPNQYEEFPIGGKIVFQRWTDSHSEYLKVEYVYPSWSQLRNGSKYSLENPPQRVMMRLNWCNTDEHGFCPWNEFIDKLKAFV